MGRALTVPDEHGRQMCSGCSWAPCSQRDIVRCVKSPPKLCGALAGGVPQPERHLRTGDMHLCVAPLEPHGLARWSAPRRGGGRRPGRVLLGPPPAGHWAGGGCRLSPGSGRALGRRRPNEPPHCVRGAGRPAAAQRCARRAPPRPARGQGARELRHRRGRGDGASSVRRFPLSALSQAVPESSGRLPPAMAGDAGTQVSPLDQRAQSLCSLRCWAAHRPRAPSAQGPAHWTGPSRAPPCGHPGSSHGGPAARRRAAG